MQQTSHKRFECSATNAVEPDLMEQHKWFQVRVSKPEEPTAPVFTEAEWIASVFKHEK